MERSELLKKIPKKFTEEWIMTFERELQSFPKLRKRESPFTASTFVFEELPLRMLNQRVSTIQSILREITRKLNDLEKTLKIAILLVIFSFLLQILTLYSLWWLR